MPTYQYACTACGEQLEAVQAFADAALTECPACSGRLRKVFSAVGVVFKGSGFYKNDSRSPAKSAPAKDSPKESSPAAATPAATPAASTSSSSSTPSSSSTSSGSASKTA